jgi:MFS family permease
MLSFMDRMMMGMLMQPIKLELHLSDTELGFLTGVAFALFYVTLGIPIARWADRGNRVTIISLALGLWGVMVGLSSFVTNFLQLALVRVGAGIGEAGVMPPSYSLIGDYFPVAQRLRALSIFMSGVSLSIAISYIFAGWMNDNYGWRAAFIIVGAPGLLLAVLVKLTLGEPRRMGAGALTTSPPVVSLRGGFALLWRQRSYRYLVIAISLSNFVGMGLGQWLPTHFIRTHGLATTEIGLWLGLIGGSCGGIATLGAGYIFDRYIGDNPRLQLRWIAMVAILIPPVYWVLIGTASKTTALLLLIPMHMQFLFFYGPVMTLLQRLVADRMRALALAVALLTMNLMGMGLGPQVVGILSDLFAPAFGTAKALALGMGIAATAAFGSGLYFWKAGAAVDADLQDQARRAAPTLNDAITSSTEFSRGLGVALEGNGSLAEVAGRPAAMH